MPRRAQQTARSVALNALRQWRSSTRFADSIIQDLLSRGLAGSDRAFALELFYGVLRNLTRLDFWIDRLREGKLDHDSRDLVRLGLYQLFILRTPEHAAVFETVKLARPRAHGLINALLRTASRQREDLEVAITSQPVSVQMSHPEFLIERWETNFGAQATEALFAWNNQPAPVYARINRLRIEPGDFLRAYPAARVVTGHEEFVECEGIPAEALRAGDCYIQDPSTIAACHLLDPQPGESVLDACAAPGGKTSYLAQMMQNRGVLAACDRDPERIQTLKANLARLGATLAQVIPWDWRQNNLSPRLASLAPFDRILLDAPCSNTGVMRRRVDVRWRLTPADFGRMQTEQLTIVRSLVPLLKSGGVLVYSTCSLEPEENDDVAVQMLSEFSSLTLTDKVSILPFRDHFDGAFAARFVVE